MRVVVAGSTGLVGSACVNELLRHTDVGEVVALVRRSWSEVPQDPRVHVEPIDFDALPGALPDYRRFDAVICALGTTMRQAGSQAAFRRVDFDYPVALARAARDQDIPHFLLVSALGARPQSRVFYNRVKGETEEAIRAMDFPRLTIVRPSLLLGNRPEFRLGEAIGRVLGFLAPPKWRPVEGSAVARTLVSAALQPVAGVLVLESAAIRKRDLA